MQRIALCSLATVLLIGGCAIERGGLSPEFRAPKADTPDGGSQPPLGCDPSCGGRSCGDDGCGGSCGECDPSEFCQEDTRCLPVPEMCVPECEGRSCGDDGCGGSCGNCGDGESCAGGSCMAICTPDCASRTCGDDGCGGSCGTCARGLDCDGDRCVSDACDDCAGVCHDGVCRACGGEAGFCCPEADPGPRCAEGLNCVGAKCRADG